MPTSDHVVAHAYGSVKKPSLSKTTKDKKSKAVDRRLPVPKDAGRAKKTLEAVFQERKAYLAPSRGEVYGTSTTADDGSDDDPMADLPDATVLDERRPSSSKLGSASDRLVEVLRNTYSYAIVAKLQERAKRFYDGVLSNRRRRHACAAVVALLMVWPFMPVAHREAKLRVMRGAWLDISVGDEVFSVLDYGARGDGQTDDTKAIQKALDKAAQVGGGMVAFPSTSRKGSSELTIYRSGRLFIRGSYTMLSIPRASCIRFHTPDELGDASGGSLPAFIMAYGVQHIGITGEGTIDGQGASWPVALSSPGLFSAINCSNLLVMGVTWRDPPDHAIMSACDFTEVWRTQVKVSNTAVPSKARGAIVRGRQVLIHDSHLETYGPNVQVGGSETVVESCYIGRGQGVMVGPLTGSVLLRNVTFRNLYFDTTTTAIGAHAVPEAVGVATGITYEGLTLNAVETAVDISIESSKLAISGVLIRNLTSLDILPTPGRMRCSGVCRGFTLEDIHLASGMTQPQPQPQPLLAESQTPLSQTPLLTDSPKQWDCSGITGSETAVEPTAYLNPQGCGLQFKPPDVGSAGMFGNAQPARRKRKKGKR